MNPWTALLIGLLLGWLIEYAIDWFFWRRKSTDEKIVADLQDQLKASEERSAELEAQLAEAKAGTEPGQSGDDEPELETTADEGEETLETDPEESQDSHEGTLAAVGVGAAAGAVIAAGGDDEEEDGGTVPADELMEDTSGEPIDAEAAAAEEISSDETAVDAEDEPIDESMVMAAVEGDIEGEPLVESEESDDLEVADADLDGEAETLEEDETVDQVFESEEAELEDETLAADAELDGEAESIEESETMDQEFEPEEIELEDEPLAADAELDSEAETLEEIETTDQVFEPEETELDIDDSGDTSGSEMPDSESEDNFPVEGADSSDENAYTSAEGGQES